MPSKRDLIGADAPFDGLHWSDVQWDRISAFFGGLGVFLLCSWVGLYRHLPDRLAAALLAVPVGLIVYGATDQSLRTAVRSAVYSAIGLGIGFYVDSVGISPFP